MSEDKKTKRTIPKFLKSLLEFAISEEQIEELEVFGIRKKKEKKLE